MLWLTGLPGAGKSTIANLVERKLVVHGRQTMLLDGDNLRQGINADLGFDSASRAENVRRVGEVAKLMTDAGLIVIVALVSPFRADRAARGAPAAGGQLRRDLRRHAARGLPPARHQGPLRAGRQGPGRQSHRPRPALRAAAQPALVLRTPELTADEAADRVVALVVGG